MWWIVLVIVSFLFIITGFIFITEEIKGGMADPHLFVIGLILFVLGCVGLGFYHHHANKPEVIRARLDKTYQERLESIDVAERNLKKFLIDHPEYMEEE